MANLNTGDTAAAQADDFPEIVLDTTLAELLAEEPDRKVTEALCNIKPCADPRHKTVPVNKKFLITSSRAKDGNDLAHLQLENGSTEDETLTAKVVDQNARKSFSVLNERQRPWPRTYSNKDDFVRNHQNSNVLVRWGFAVDFAEQIPSFIHPELQYRLNSKRWLAECALKSANDRIIDPGCSCPAHTTKDGLWYFGTDCSSCRTAVEKEVSRLEEKLRSTEPPFVLKIAQSLGSVGTMLVKNNDERDEAIKQITEVQSQSLPFVTADNAHIYPASLVLSDFLPGITNALNFYVRGDGSVKFLGACHQLSTRTTEGGRQHTALTWSEQDKLEAKFKDSLRQIGEVLKSEGYFGPCGADIIESEDGSQYVIDLNVRSATSLVLGCLKQHCKKRNFNVCGIYECLLLSLSRDHMEGEFAKELKEGRLMLLGNTRLGQKNQWAYPVVIAGEDQESLKAMSAKLLKFEATDGGDAQDAGGA